MLAFREHRQLVQVFGKPCCLLGQVDKAVLDHRSRSAGRRVDGRACRAREWDRSVWWTRSLSLAPPSAVVPFNYLSLVWATILGYAVWGDVPTPGLLVGSTIVVASGLYILWRETVRHRRPSVPAPQRV